MKTLRIGTFLLLVALTLMPLGCSSTSFESTWRDPKARPVRLEGKKVVAIFITNRGLIRRRAEDAMAREISARGAQGVPAYTILSDQEIKDPEAARPKLEKLGFSGAVTMRVVGRETQYTYQPDAVWVRPYYHTFWGGYWRWGWGTVYEPGYLVADRIVRVETLVYSLDQDLLIWAGVSRTIDPEQLENFIGELATAVTKQMTKDGLLHKAS
jgi:hypothetical protein